MKSEEEKGEDVWSEWLDFDQSNITKAAIPDKSGVFKVHASMKVINSKNRNFFDVCAGLSHISRISLFPILIITC